MDPKEIERLKNITSDRKKYFTGMSDIPSCQRPVLHLVPHILTSVKAIDRLPERQHKIL